MSAPLSSWRTFTDDLPAYALAMVSAVTVAQGAVLLRQQSFWLMLTLGVGVAGATVVLDRHLVERLNSIRPKQNLLSLGLCWFVLFSFAVFLATVATFAWLTPQEGKREAIQAFRSHWVDERKKVGDYLLGIRSDIGRQVDDVELAIGAERRAIADARKTGQSPVFDRLQDLQKRRSALLEVQKQAETVTTPPMEPPAQEVAQAQLERSFGVLGDLYVRGQLVLPNMPAPPTYDLFTPPVQDLQTVLVNELRERSPEAIVALILAFWVEILPLVALYRGGRKTGLAARIVHRRQWLADVRAALRSDSPTSQIPIRIVPLEVEGVMSLALLPTMTVRECEALIEQAVASLNTSDSMHEVTALMNASSVPLDPDEPLLGQLGAGPLVVQVRRSATRGSIGIGQEDE